MKTLNGQQKVLHHTRNMWLSGATMTETIQSLDSISLTWYFDAVMLYNSLDAEFKKACVRINVEVA